MKNTLPRLILLVLSLSLISCTEKQSDDTASQQQGGSIVIGFLSEPETLNPLAASSSHEHDIIDLLFLKLMREEADFLGFEPELAESWSFDASGLVLTFVLRDDLSWHDGRPVTAEDVAFTFALQTNAEVAWSGRSSKDRIDRVEVVDPHRVVFHFKSRYPYQLMDANDGHILPKHLLAGIAPESMRTNDFGRNPVGCGPYRFTQWESNQYIKVTQDPGYPSSESTLDEVVFRFVPDETSLMTSLKTGEIDCTKFLTTDAVRDLRRNYRDVRVHEYPLRSMIYISWNTTRPPFDRRDVRRALAYAIDAEAVIQTVWAGMADVSDSPMHPVLWAHDASIKAIPHDPLAASQQLERLGWSDSDGDGVLDRDGEPFEFDMMTNQSAQQRIDAIAVIQSQLAEIGVKVNVRVMEFGALIDAVVKKGDFDSCVFGYNSPTRADLKNFWATGAAFNMSRYSNADVDALIDRARSAPTAEDSRALWYECQRVIYDDQPHYFLAVPYGVAGINARYCNVQPNAQSFFFNLPQWYIGDDCH